VLALRHGASTARLPNGIDLRNTPESHSADWPIGYEHLAPYYEIIEGELAFAVPRRLRICRSTSLSDGIDGDTRAGSC